MRTTVYCVLGLGIVAIAALYFWGRNHINFPGPWAAARAQAADLSVLKVADGYQVGFFAEPELGLESPRQLAEGDNGWVFVGSRTDKVYALRDQDEDGAANEVRIVAQGMKTPHGVAFDPDSDNLYVGAIDGIYVINDISQKLADEKSDLTPRQVIGGFVESGWHGTRHIKIGADGMLYVSLGTPCNICEPPDPNFTGVIRRYLVSALLPDTDSQDNSSNSGTDADGEVFARGVRNSVGFDFHPVDGALWFTDNGRDWLGDDLPSDELNRAPEAGMHFGFPYCHQGDFTDPEFGDAASCDQYEKPALNTGAHVANLGMAFDPKGEHVYIALHGSWNRSEKTGYAVHRARATAGGEVSEYQPFVSGWLQGESVSGRPADVVFLADGDLLISDDFANVIYRVKEVAL